MSGVPALLLLYYRDAKLGGSRSPVATQHPKSAKEAWHLMRAQEPRACDTRSTEIETAVRELMLWSLEWVPF